jgi:hypothetical protein
MSDAVAMHYSGGGDLAEAIAASLGARARASTP